MKKKQTKIDNSAPATKKDLNAVKKDLNKVSVVLEGKIGGLDNKIGGLEGETQDLRSQIEQVEEGLGKKMKNYHNEVMTELDSIAGAIKKFDEEHTVLAYRQVNHTDRIEKLETTVFGKPSE